MATSAARLIAIIADTALRCFRRVPDENRLRTNYSNKRPVQLNASQRAAVERGVRETCELREWNLWTINVRSNHLHCVVTAHYNAKRVTSALKGNATRAMRESGCWRSDLSPWARGGSTKYLWTTEELVNAIAYVEYDQGEPLK